MKSLKIYLAVVSFLLFAAVICGVYVWYQLQQTHVQIEKNIENEIVLPKTTENISSEQKGAETAPVVEKVNPTETAAPPNPPVPAVTKPIVVDTNTLSDSQQKILKTFGFDEGTLTITPAMISCAENAVGKERLQAILDGSSPSTLESIKILPCFKA